MVWWEMKDVAASWVRREKPASVLLRSLSLHAKIVLSATLFLIAFGSIVVLIAEYKNPLTLGPMSFPEKCMAALFQSVTTRTAGFYTVNQTGLTDTSTLTCMLLMFIGGSPAGTAGGIKTMTVAILIAAVLSEIRGRDTVVAFRRTISSGYVRKALTIVGFSFAIWISLTLLLCAVENLDSMKVCYETVSAIGTVGLSKDLTVLLNTPGKVVIICLMYAGRIGPVTLASAFLTREKPDTMIHYADETVLLG